MFFKLRGGNCGLVFKAHKTKYPNFVLGIDLTKKYN